MGNNFQKINPPYGLGSEACKDAESVWDFPADGASSQGSERKRLGPLSEGLEFPIPRILTSSHHVLGVAEASKEAF